MKPLKIVIIGASFAGISSALTAKRIHKDTSVTIIDRQETVGFIPSSVNRMLKGKTKHLTEETAMTKERLTEAGIELMLEKEVTSIDPKNKQIQLRHNGEESIISYDKLILAMGSDQTSERIQGADHPNVLTTKTVAASEKSQEELEKSDHILIVGGGQVGLEAADAYTIAGKKVTLVEAFDTLAFKSFDREMVVELEKRMADKGVTIYKNQQAESIQEKDTGLVTTTSQNQQIASDHVLLAVSFRPNSGLVRNQLETHLDKTFVINDYLETSQEDIYATGDLIRVPYKGTGSDYYLPFVNNAMITGRLAAMNALGLKEPLKPLVRVAGSQLFGLYIASAGLTEEEAQLYKQTISILHHQTDDQQRPITMKLIVEKESGRLLGGQVYSEANILGIVDTLAVAIKANMLDRDLAFLDYLYYSMDTTMMPVLHGAALSIYQKRIKGANENAT